MKISIILLGLLIITQCTALESDQLQQEKDLLKKLRDTDSLGKNIMETIELELSSGTDEHILDRVISMLHELLDSLSAQQADQKVEVETKNTECGEKFKDLRAEVQDFTERIATAELVLPSRQSDYDNKQDQLSLFQENFDFANKQLAQIEQQYLEAKGKYTASKDEHDSIIAALQEAKRIIKQLSAEQSFLQKQETPKIVMAQLNTHHDNVMTLKIAKHYKQMFSFLIETAQVGIQAKQDQVSGVLNIIDELIAQEEEVRAVEYQAFQKRTSKYEADKERNLGYVQSAVAQIADCQADMSTIKTRLKELQMSIDDWRVIVAQKQEQLTDNLRVCTDQQATLQNRIGKYDELLEILRQVIVLVEHSSLQEIRGAVADMDPDAILANEDQYDPLVN